MSPAAPQLPRQLPAPFGRYRLLRLLGEGGMGAVYLAQDTQLERQVALKIPNLEAGAGAVVLARFRREAQAAAALQHPNICPVHEVGEVDGVPYLTMTYIEGKPLAALIASGKLVAMRQCVLFVRKLAMALAEAHKRGVIHRDLKPGNIMMDQRGEPIIMDFGLARRSRPGEERVTQKGAALGTPAYMPPEQVQGKVEEMGPGCDIYALGVILYELLTGRLPFAGKDMMAMLSAVLLDEPPPPSRYRSELPLVLDTICLKAMAKKVKSRYATMTELANALQDHLRGATAEAQAPAPAYDLGPPEQRPTPNPAVAATQLGGSRPTVEPAAEKPIPVRTEARSRRRGSGGRGLSIPIWWWAVGGAVAGLLVVFPAGWIVYRALEPAEDLAPIVAQPEPVPSPPAQALPDATAVQPRSDEPAVVPESEDAPVHYKRGKELYDKGKKQDAMVEFQKAVDLDPQFALPQAGLGQILCDQGHRNEAREKYERALELDPRLVLAAVGLGDILYAQGKRDEARGAYQKAAEIDQLAGLPHAGLGDILREEGKPEEAEGEYQKALRLDPKLARPHDGLARILHSQGRRDEAKVEFRKAIDVDSRYARPHHGLGMILIEQGQLDLARKETEKAIDLDPRFSRAHNNLGLIHQRQGRPEEAKAEYQKAIQFDPEQAVPHNNLATILMNQGQHEDARIELRKAVQIDPKFMLGHANLVGLLRHMGRLEEAEAEYGKIIELEPRAAHHHNDLGTLLQGQGRLGEAKEAFTKAIELNAKFASAHHNLGTVLRAQGQLEEAREEYRKATELDARFAAPHLELGDLWHSEGRLEDAVAEWRKATELGDQGAAPRLRECEQLLALRRRLPGLIAGRDRPANSAERLAFADYCRQPWEGRYALSARLYAEAFATKPGSANDLGAGHRYKAACAAALAGCGRGKDAPQQDETERARLRGQARTWLQADVRARRPDNAARQQLARSWQEEADLAGVRDVAALAKLPEAERQLWQKFWQDLAGRSGAGPGRSYWRYGDGAFKYLGKYRWVERKDSGTSFRFIEKHRTDAYIELYDRGRDCWVRLHDTYFEVKAPFTRQRWSRYPDGKWTTE
jgi:Tfp pilus assembly protein PilF